MGNWPFGLPLADVVQPGGQHAQHRAQVGAVGLLVPAGTAQDEHGGHASQLGGQVQVGVGRDLPHGGVGPGGQADVEGLGHDVQGQLGLLGAHGAGEIGGQVGGAGGLAGGQLLGHLVQILAGIEHLPEGGVVQGTGGQEVDRRPGPEGVAPAVGLGEQHGGHGAGVGHVVHPVAEVDGAAARRLAGVVHDQHVAGDGGDPFDVGLELALDVGDDQAVAVAHPVGDGGQDDALGLARALGAKDGHAAGDVLAAEAEAGRRDAGPWPPRTGPAASSPRDRACASGGRSLSHTDGRCPGPAPAPHRAPVAAWPARPVCRRRRCCRRRRGARQPGAMLAAVTCSHLRKARGPMRSSARSSTSPHRAELARPVQADEAHHQAHSQQEDGGREEDRAPGSAKEP